MHWNLTGAWALDKRLCSIPHLWLYLFRWKGHRKVLLATTSKYSYLALKKNQERIRCNGMGQVLRVFAKWSPGRIGIRTGIPALTSSASLFQLPRSPFAATSSLSLCFFWRAPDTSPVWPPPPPLPANGSSTYQSPQETKQESLPLLTYMVLRSSLTHHRFILKLYV